MPVDRHLPIRFRRRLRLLGCLLATGIGLLSPPAGAASYFVNDAQTAGDFYCAGPGKESYTGLTPDRPQSSLKTLLQTQTLAPGDTVYVDTGTYGLTSPVYVTAAATGTAESPVTILGAPVEGKTILQAGQNVDGCLGVSGGAFVRFRLLSLRAQKGEGFRGMGSTDITLERCDVRKTASHGFRFEDCENITLEGCVANTNAADGLSLENCSGTMTFTDLTVIGNRHNVRLDHTSGARFDRLLSVGATGTLSLFYAFESPQTLIRQATLAGACHGVVLLNSPSATLANSILQVSGDGSACVVPDVSSQSGLYCEYNDLYPTGSAIVGVWNSETRATLAAWQSVTGKDLLSLSADPYFADAAKGDYHLKSRKGRYDPATGVFVVDAVHSPAIDAGDPTAAVGEEAAPNGSLVNLGYFGTSPQASLSYTHTGGEYYVNDDSVADDIYCIAVGDSDATGTSPARPADSLATVLSKVTLGPGDTVYIDTGTYAVDATLTFGTELSGTAQETIHILGSPRGTVLSLGSSAARARGARRADGETAYVFHLQGSYIQLENLSVSGAGVAGFQVSGGRWNEFISCVSHGNTFSGIGLEDASSITVRNCLVYANGQAGLRAEGTGSLAIENSTFYHNKRELHLLKSPDVSITNCIFEASGNGGYLFYLDEASQVGFASRYNTLRARNGAYFARWVQDYMTLDTWKAAAMVDFGSDELDPLFVDADGADQKLGGSGYADDDFHLRSTTASYHGGAWEGDSLHSPAIDAGDPDLPVRLEPSPNGSRLNRGAYGGTRQASHSREGTKLYCPLFDTTRQSAFALANVGEIGGSVTLTTIQGETASFFLDAGASVTYDLQGLGITPGLVGAYRIDIPTKGALVIGDAWILEGTDVYYTPLQPLRNCASGSFYAVSRGGDIPMETTIAFFNPANTPANVTLNFHPIAGEPSSHGFVVDVGKMTRVTVSSTVFGIPDGETGSFSIGGDSSIQVAAWVKLGGVNPLPVTVAKGSDTQYLPYATTGAIDLLALHNESGSSANVYLQAVTGGSAARARPRRQEGGDGGSTGDAGTTGDAASPFGTATGTGQVAASAGGPGLALASDAGLKAPEAGGYELRTAGAEVVADSWILLPDNAYWVPLAARPGAYRASLYNFDTAAGFDTLLLAYNTGTATANITVVFHDLAGERRRLSGNVLAGETQALYFSQLVVPGEIGPVGWFEVEGAEDLVSAVWVIDANHGRVFPVLMQ